LKSKAALMSYSIVIFFKVPKKKGRYRCLFKLRKTVSERVSLYLGKI
jgi:hypothetical protein